MFIFAFMITIVMLVVVALDALMVVIMMMIAMAVAQLSVAAHVMVGVVMVTDSIEASLVMIFDVCLYVSFGVVGLTR